MIVIVMWNVRCAAHSNRNSFLEKEKRKKRIKRKWFYFTFNLIYVMHVSDVHEDSVWLPRARLNYSYSLKLNNFGIA